MDFNFRVHPVPARIAIALDQSDIYISLANALAKEPFIKAYGGMELKASSLGKKSTALVAQAVILRTVRGACEGRAFQESNLTEAANPVLTDATFDAELVSISTFFTEIANRMGTIRWAQKDSLHLTAPGWQALGVIHHDIRHRGIGLTDDEIDAMLNVIAGIDWTRSNKAWVDEAGLGQWAVPKGATTEQVIITGAGRSNTQSIIDYVRRLTGIPTDLDNQELPEEDLLPENLVLASDADQLQAADELHNSIHQLRFGERVGRSTDALFFCSQAAIGDRHTDDHTGAKARPKRKSDTLICFGSYRNRRRAVRGRCHSESVPSSHSFLVVT